jgi:hypothetical protein
VKKVFIIIRMEATSSEREKRTGVPPVMMTGLVLSTGFLRLMSWGITQPMATARLAMGSMLFYARIAMI